MATDAYSGTPVRSADEPVVVESESHLDAIVDEQALVLVDFYADWCGPGQMLDPILRGLAAETDAVIAKVDVDAHQDLAAAYGVRGVPMLVLFADGEQVDQQVGAVPADQLRALIERYDSE